jgi:CBS domain-containing protein
MREFESISRRQRLCNSWGGNIISSIDTNRGTPTGKKRIMTAGQICARGVETAMKNESVYVAACRMNDRNVDSLVIVDESATPIGIITDRDLRMRVLAEDNDPHFTTVGEVMSESLSTVNRNTEIERALEIMRSGPYRRLPVVDEAGVLIGLLTIEDILDELAIEFHLVGS